MRTLYNKSRDYSDRFLIIVWSKSWRNILDPSEEKSVLLCPDMKKGIIELVLELLMTGEASGLEKDFENFFEAVLDIFDYLLDCLRKGQRT